MGEKRDLRAEAMDTAEGRGVARRAWDAYAEKVNELARPITTPLIRSMAARWSEDLLGFYVMWHLYGGFEGLRRAGMARSTIFRKLKRFRLVFGTHPDSYEIAGIKLDPEAFWESEGHFAKRTE